MMRKALKTTGEQQHDWNALIFLRSEQLTDFLWLLSLVHIDFLSLSVYKPLLKNSKTRLLMPPGPLTVLQVGINHHVTSLFQY